MSAIIILFTIFVLLGFWYIIGNAIEVVLQKDLTHKTIMGFFFYFTLYGVISIPLALMHVAWNFFFMAITIFNILLLFAAIGILYYHRKRITFSKDKTILFLRKNAVLLSIIGIYFIVYLLSDYSLFWHVNRGAIWDHSYYAAKANAAIGSANILLINPKYGYIESPLASLVNSTITWELFWSYIASITHLSINQVSKLVLPVITYIVVFFTYDTIFKKMFKSKEQVFYKGYIILFALYMIYTTAYDGFQDDVAKFMYFPWYGNVFVTMLFIPLTIYLSFQTLKNAKYLILLFLQIVFFNVFSAGGIMYVALFYPIFIVYWKFFKTYKMKFENIFTIGSLFVLLALNVAYALSQRSVQWIEQDRMLAYFSIFIPVFLFSSIGIILLFKKNHLRKEEKFTVFVLLGFIILLILEPASGFLFQQYRFALHRFGLSVMIVYTIIGITGYVETLRNNKKLLIIGLIPFLLVAQKNYDFFLLKNRDNLNVHNLFNIDRETEEVLEVAQFLNSKQSETGKNVYYCVYGADAYTYSDKRFKTKYFDSYIDIGSMVITETKNVYEAYVHTDTLNRDLTVDQFFNSDCQYLITDVDALVEYTEEKGGSVVKTLTSNKLVNSVRVVDLQSIKGKE